MTDWYTVLPDFSCIAAKPFTPEEIDSHPDCARIWATIMVIRDQWEDDMVNLKSQRYAEENLN